MRPIQVLRGPLMIGVLVTCMLMGCYGRIPDEVGQRIDAKAYGLDGVRPALLVFGAAWCKPCKSEIPSLNRAYAEVGSQLQIVNFLVEGAQKGVASKTGDSTLFVSPRGEKPEYSLKLDPNWTLFDFLKPAQGRVIPTLAFIGRSQNIEQIVQRSMEFESELLPMLRALVAGKPSKPAPKEPVDEGNLRVIEFAQWVAVEGNEVGGAIYLNIEQAWQRGLDDFAFFAEDMPFSEARFSVVEYASGKLETKSAQWNAALTGCRLTVFLKPDGKYDRSEGICR